MTITALGLTRRLIKRLVDFRTSIIKFFHIRYGRRGKRFPMWFVPTRNRPERLQRFLFVPTRNRPERLQRFLDGCIATGMIMPGLIVVDGEDGGDYSSVKLPLNWKIETASVRIDAGGRQ